MNLVYFMQAFEKLKLFYLFSPNHYVIVLQYSFLLIYIFFYFCEGYEYSDTRGRHTDFK